MKLHWCSKNNQPPFLWAAQTFKPTDFGRGFRTLKENRPTLHTPKVLWPGESQAASSCWHVGRHGKASSKRRVETHPSGVFCVEQMLILRNQQKNGGEKTEMTFLVEGKLKAQAWRHFDHFVFHVFWKDILFEGGFFCETTFIFFESLWN